MFFNVGKQVIAQYPSLIMEELIVDACAMKLVMQPERFQVIATTNLFGDILSDVAAGVVGGLGMVGSANIGAKYAMFEAVHGCAPDIADKNIANPSALILAGCMMHEAAEKLHKSLLAVLEEGVNLTPDLLPSSKIQTHDMGKAILSKLQTLY